MKNLLLILSCFIVFSNPMLTAQENKEFSIIPQPQSIKELPGEFTINSKTKIYIDSDNTELRSLSIMLVDRLKDVSGIKIPVIEETGFDEKNAIILTLRHNNLEHNHKIGKEGYELTVRPENIVLRASKGQGIFYGLQTIYQLLPIATYTSKSREIISIPSVAIFDEPRYEWRGMMLDTGRYFYPVSFIKKFIDYLAMHKMNVFHWGLVQDHGWRIEIKKYPELTSKSAWRNATEKPWGRMDHSLHGGYYTQDEIREVVAYAKDRYVTVVPEIEMPGHALSALVVHPELSCTGGPFKIPERWGIQKDIYCAGNEKTFEFLENVLSEVVELFPSPIIHIGGDEAPKDRWAACSKCQARIEEEGLKNEHELQSYFITRIAKFLATKDKQIIGWDEILQGGLPPNAAVMSWRGTKGGITAAKQHHNVVMTPTSHMYFDYHQGNPKLEPIAVGHTISLHKVYSYEPTPIELSKEEAKYIMGVQGNIWMEWIHSAQKVEYMAFPRAAALAEIAWTQPERKDWKNFKRKMEVQYDRYENMGINYAKTAYNVRQEVKIDTTSRTATISFTTESFDPQIYYTLDGSEPTSEASKYGQPFKVDEPVLIKAATFKNDKRVSKISKTYLNWDSYTKKN